MIAAGHQPNYLPYLGFFDKMAKADLFMIGDNLSYTRGDFHNRNKIRVCSGWKWLTIPVDDSKIPLNQKKIKNEVQIAGKPWYEYHINLIEESYHKTPFFADYFPKLKEIYASPGDILSDFSTKIILFLKEAAGIKTEIMYSSSIKLDERKSERIVEYCKMLGIENYLAGQGAREYLDEKLFSDAGISLSYQEFTHPTYKQSFPGFEPNMASIDALFNEGKILF
jgi:hypothetical protein